MISNEQRRKAAKELRNQLEHMRQNAEWHNEELDAVECGNRAYRGIACSIEEHGNTRSGNYVRIVERLAELIELQLIDGETSDGYHTFNELYHHRAVLFSVIVSSFSDRAWKSKLHTLTAPCTTGRSSSASRLQTGKRRATTT